MNYTVIFKQSLWMLTLEWSANIIKAKQKDFSCVSQNMGKSLIFHIS